MKLSLAGWSLQSLMKPHGDMPAKLDLVDFPAFAADQFGIQAVELNSPFFASKDAAYLHELVASADRAGVKLLNIAVDEEGDMSSADETEREIGVESYLPWIDIASAMGIKVIRANSGGNDATTPEDIRVKHGIDSFRRMCDAGVKAGVTVLIENHWGISSNPDAMMAIIDGVTQTHGKEAIGTLPDFGNWPEGVDRFESMAKILPRAKAIHAKIYDIDRDLNHPSYSLEECVKVCRKAGYAGFLGLEFEGKGDCMIGVRRGVSLLRSLI